MYYISKLEFLLFFFFFCCFHLHNFELLRSKWYNLSCKLRSFTVKHLYSNGFRFCENVNQTYIYKPTQLLGMFDIRVYHLQSNSIGLFFMKEFFTFHFSLWVKILKEFLKENANLLIDRHILCFIYV